MGKILDFIFDTIAKNKAFYESESSNYGRQGADFAEIEMKESEPIKQRKEKDEFSVIYSHGHIVQITPNPTFGKNYYDILDKIRALEYIVSDGKSYNLTDIRSVYSINVQNYSSPENDYRLSSFGAIEYLLMEKAFHCSRGDLGIAHLRKAVELMKKSDVKWGRMDFQRLVWRFNDFGAKSDAATLERWYKSNVLTDEQEAELIVAGKIDGELKRIHKEILMVKRVTIEDMMQFPNIPYQLNCPIHKNLGENSHPFACMDLNEFNQSVARRDLNMINKLIADSREHIHLLSDGFQIDITEVSFQQYSAGYGYTRIMCEPYTLTGKVSKYPISLSFTTRMDIHFYSANGNLFYEKDGSIGKGSVHICRSGTGWSFTLKKINGALSVSEAKTTLLPDKYGRAGTAYKI